MWRKSWIWISADYFCIKSPPTCGFISYIVIFRTKNCHSLIFIRKGKAIRKSPTINQFPIASNQFELGFRGSDWHKLQITWSIWSVTSSAITNIIKWTSDPKFPGEREKKQLKSHPAMMRFRGPERINGISSFQCLNNGDDVWTRQIQGLSWRRI